MTTEISNKFLQLESIFMSHTVFKRNELCKNKHRFVHYTSAENAINIIKNKQFWLRNAKCMNDYNEIEHGHSMLLQYFQDSEKNTNRIKFIEVFDSVEVGLALKIFYKFDEWWNRVNYNTYIGSISEHMETESSYGRLSMWRAYGKNSAKAALVLNIPLEPENAINLENTFLVPVAYFDQAELEAHLNYIASSVESSLDFLRSVEASELENMLFLTLVILSVTLKHKGFSEEKEWRIVYLPLLYENPTIQDSVESISGIPQKVCKITLEDSIERGVSGLAINTLVSEILIGPTEYPAAIYDAFCDLLIKAGIETPWERVKISNIPLRANA